MRVFGSFHIRGFSMKKRYVSLFLFLSLAFSLFACSTPTPPPSEPPTPKASRICSSDADCLQGYLCQDKQCKLCMQCLHIGEKRCTDKAQWAICEAKADGCSAWSAPNACAAENICQLGDCIPTPQETCVDLCILGDKRCIEGVPYLCTPSEKCNQWKAQNACASDQSCADGLCVSKTTSKGLEIVEFSADTELELPEAPVTLTWQVKGAAYVFLQPLGISVSPSGSLLVQDASDVTYTLEAYFGEQVVKQSATIRRDPNPPLTTIRPRLHDSLNVFQMTLLGREEFCRPVFELRHPDGKTETLNMDIDNVQDGGRRQRSVIVWKLSSEGEYKYRLSITKTTDVTDCSTPAVKRWFYPASDGQGEAPWKSFSYKQNSTTEPPPTCKDTCKVGDTRCHGTGYQICEKAAFGCPVWSASIECPQGSQCTADGAGCFTSQVVDRSAKEIKVNPGTFRRGAGIGNNYQGTPTTIAHSFFMWKHEFTVREYVLLMKVRRRDGGMHMPVDENLPYDVMYDWNSYVLALNRLSQQYNLPPCYACSSTGGCQEFPQYQGENFVQCPGYRLPTLNEWEYAYRAGTTMDFYNGNLRSSSETVNPHLDAIGWYHANSQGKPHPVGQKQPNAWGFYDMAGNLNELVAFSGGWGFGGSFQESAAGCTAISTSNQRHGFRPVRTAQ